MSKGKQHVPTPPAPRLMPRPPDDRPWAGRPHRVLQINVSPVIELLTEDGKGDGTVVAGPVVLPESQIPEAIWEALLKAGLNPKR